MIEEEEAGGVVWPVEVCDRCGRRERRGPADSYFEGGTQPFRGETFTGSDGKRRPASYSICMLVVEPSRHCRDWRCFCSSCQPEVERVLKAALADLGAGAMRGHYRSNPSPDEVKAKAEGRA